jgi:hypothetical protein
MKPLSTANAILFDAVTSDAYALRNVLIYAKVDKANNNMFESVVKM